jgi:hypothetical protein
MKNMWLENACQTAKRWYRPIQTRLWPSKKNGGATAGSKDIPKKNHHSRPMAEIIH